MRILHVTSSLDPVHGGPPAVVLGLASAMKQGGHEPTILHARPGPDGRERTDKSIRAAGVDAASVREFEPVGGVKAWLGGPMRAALDGLVPSADIVHIHELWTPLAFHAARAARRHGTPYVMTPHGMLHPWSLAQGKLKKQVALALAFNGALRGAAFVHALNDDEAMHVRRFSPRVEVIPNGIVPEQFASLPARGSFRSERGLGDAPTVLFLSRLHYKKGLDILADAFAIVAKAMPDARLIVAGPDGGAQAGFVEQIDRLGVRERVTLTGPLYGASKFGALVDADVFCLPSRQEGFSMAILEALACGTPAVVSAECCFPEVGTRGCGVVTDRLEASRVADGLLVLLRDRAKARAMGETGRAMVLREYTWPAIAAKMTGAYAKHARR